MHTYDIVILGAGLAGLGMGAQLKRAGIDDFIIVEKASEVGGVWRDNSYPGAACDIEARLYSYQFFPHITASKAYADQPEILTHIHALVDQFNLSSHLKLNSEITQARWHDDAHYWALTLNDARQIKGRIFIPAWGQLSTPQIPDFKGLDKFQGDCFHSARWNHNIDLTDKIVASIGAAASAVQYIPEIAKVTKKLTIYQRSANWIHPRDQVTFDPAEIAQFLQQTELYETYRTEAYEALEARFDKLQQGSELQQQLRQKALEHLHEEILDPILRQQLTPDYEYGCRRVLITSDYYPTLRRDNVFLQTTPIQEITAEGIITHDDQLHLTDVIILGTGFKSQDFQGDLMIIGEHGLTLKEQWHEGAEAYLGMTVPGFPNMFLMYGPNTNLNHNSILAMLEVQQAYTLQAISVLLLEKNSALTVKKSCFSEYNQTLQSDLQTTAFTSGCSSWYQNTAGKIINNWPHPVDEYRIRAATLNLDDYRFQKEQ